MTSEGEGPDLGALLSQLGQLREQLEHAQTDAATQVIQGAAGGGAVQITATGGLDVQSVHIDPAVLGEVEDLEDLVLAAVRDLVERAHALQAGTLGAAAGGLGELFGE